MINAAPTTSKASATGTMINPFCSSPARKRNSASLHRLICRNFFDTENDISLQTRYNLYSKNKIYRFISFFTSV